MEWMEEVRRKRDDGRWKMSHRSHRSHRILRDGLVIFVTQNSLRYRLVLNN